MPEPSAAAAVQVELAVRPGVPRLLPDDECRFVLAAALVAGGAPPGARVSLTLSDDAELAGLNEAHMGKAGPTDVLSFPLLPPAAFPEHKGQDPATRREPDAFPLPPGEAPHLGDVIISVERAIEQAASGAGGQSGDISWAPADELRLLITHGGLHLCGWDHAAAVEEAAMRALERELLGMGPEASGFE
ncbi:MAG TPA: rRNA maturation RNase YbeY [Anaerolineae bacterium]|nr:rRNA maturation RNase YbeY [Anaerolineae bacterium]